MARDFTPAELAREDAFHAAFEELLQVVRTEGKALGDTTTLADPAVVQELIENRRPKDCCRVHSRIVTKQEIETEWTVRDLVDWNEILTELDDAEQRAREKA